MSTFDEVLSDILDGLTAETELSFELLAQMERVLTEVHNKALQEARIAEWQKLIDDINKFNNSERKPGERRTDDFGRAGASMERAGFKSYAENRIKELSPTTSNGDTK